MHGLFLLLLPALRDKALSELPEAGWETLPGDIEHQDHDEEGENEGHGAGDHLVDLHGILSVFAGESHGDRLGRAVGLPLPVVSECGGRAGGEPQVAAVGDGREQVAAGGLGSLLTQVERVHGVQDVLALRVLGAGALQVAIVAPLEVAEPGGQGAHVAPTVPEVPGQGDTGQRLPGVEDPGLDVGEAVGVQLQGLEVRHGLEHVGLHVLDLVARQVHFLQVPHPVQRADHNGHLVPPQAERVQGNEAREVGEVHLDQIVVLFSFPTNRNLGRFRIFHILVNTCYFSFFRIFFKYSHPSGYEVVFHCGFGLNLSND